MSYLKSNTLFDRIQTEDLYERIPRPMLIADHLLTPDNLGAMIRLADNIGATEMCFLGKEEEHRLGKVRRLLRGQGRLGKGAGHKDKYGYDGGAEHARAKACWSSHNNPLLW